MVPEPRHQASTASTASASVLERRTPGVTDVRIFTTKVLPAGRHRLDEARLRPRISRDGFGRPVLRLLALAVAAVLGVSACAAGSTPGTGGQTTQRAAGGGEPVRLAGVCPSTVVIQSSWFPQVEHAVVYQLLGKGYRLDTNHKTVTGPLVAHGGVDTGVRLQIRAGGPAIGGQQVSAQMYTDPSITLGMLATDETVQNAVAQPTVAVLAPFDVDPLALIWDPATHPEFNSIADIGQTDVPVLFFQGESTYIDYLTGSGLLRRSQVDGSYQGTPDRLVTSRGQVVSQGFATSEPWKWQHEVPRWGKPLSYALVSDAGYPDYRNQLAIRARDRDRLAPCLRRLVPVLQQALVDFMTTPQPTTATILAILGRYKVFYTDSPARSAYAVAIMRRQGLVSNGTNTTIGDFDPDRVRKIIAAVTPIYRGQHKPVRDGLQPTDVATNDFINPTISLPGSR